MLDMGFEESIIEYIKKIIEDHKIKRRDIQVCLSSGLEKLIKKKSKENYIKRR